MLSSHVFQVENVYEIYKLNTHECWGHVSEKTLNAMHRKFVKMNEIIIFLSFTSKKYYIKSRPNALS